MPPAAVVMVYGSIITSALASVAFCTALIIAYMSKDQPNLALLIGCVVTNFTAVVQYWIGSSAGSQKKDDIISGSKKP